MLQSATLRGDCLIANNDELLAGLNWERLSFNSCGGRRGWGQLISVTRSATEELLMMGGFDGLGQCLNDIWRSIDEGLSWELLLDSAPWSSRAVFASCASSDGSRLYVMGGSSAEQGGFCSDVWSSSDGGYTWSEVTRAADWQPRSGFAALVSPWDALDVTVFGGSTLNFRCLNDIWRSTDGGLTWRCLAACAPWAPRVDMGVCQLQDGTIVLSGGDDWDNRFFSDIWISKDRGCSWQQVVINSPSWAPRAGHSLLAMYDGSLRLIGGNVTCLKANKIFREPDIERLADVWSSYDQGTTWRKITDATFGPRTLHRAVSTSTGSIILFGGWRGVTGKWQQGNAFYSDVWRSRMNRQQCDLQKSWLASRLGHLVKTVGNDVWINNILGFLFPVAVTR